MTCDLTFRYPIAAIHQYTAIHRIQGVSVSHTALNWIIENQLGRRNLNPEQVRYLRGQRYECEKKIVSNEKGVNQYSKVVRCQNGIQPPSEKEKRNPTASRLADEYGVGTRSIIRDAQFAKVVDILPKDKRNEVLNGGERISLNDADTILKFPKPIQTKFIKEVEKGTTIKEAVKKVDPEAKEVDILRFEYNTLSLYQRNG